MKKILCLVLAAIMALALVACSNGGSDAADETKAPAETQSQGVVDDRDIDIAALGEKMVTELNVEARKLSVDALGELYDIDTSDVADASSYIADGGSFPDEIIIVKATDSEAAARVQALLEARLETVREQSRNYDEQNYAQAQECKVMTSGSYVALFVSSQHAAMESMFEEATK